LAVSEVPIHFRLASLFETCGEAAYNAGSVWWSKTTQEVQKEEEGAMSHNPSQWRAPHDLRTSARLYLQRILHLPVVSAWGPSLWGTFNMQIVATTICLHLLCLQVSFAGHKIITFIRNYLNYATSLFSGISYFS
jgi:hypothetical protein